MKKVLLFIVSLAILASCTKDDDPYNNDDQKVTQFPEIGGKIQYPDGYMKEKIDNIDNPILLGTNILVDLTKNDSETKNILLTTEYIDWVGFNIAAFHHSSPFYAHPSYDCYNDPDWRDLNQDAGGSYIYFYYTKTSTASDAITNYWVTFSYTDYSCLDVGEFPLYVLANLNHSAGGNHVYANKQANGYGNKMRGLGTIWGNSSSISAPAGWTKIAGDLNAGAGGLYIYFIVKWV